MTEPLPAPVAPATRMCLLSTGTVHGVPSSTRPIVRPSASPLASSGMEAASASLWWTVTVTHPRALDRVDTDLARKVCARASALLDQSATVCPVRSATVSTSALSPIRACLRIGMHGLPFSMTVRL